MDLTVFHERNSRKPSISIFLFHSNGHRDHNGVLFSNDSILLRMEVKFQLNTFGKGFKSIFVLNLFPLLGTPYDNYIKQAFKDFNKNYAEASSMEREVDVKERKFEYL